MPTKTKKKAAKKSAPKKPAKPAAPVNTEERPLSPMRPRKMKMTDVEKHKAVNSIREKIDRLKQDVKYNNEEIRNIEKRNDTIECEIDVLSLSIIAVNEN